MHETIVRLAGHDDAEKIAAIYNHYVLTSTATFDTVETSARQRIEWLTDRGPEHPVTVAERAGVVVGWGSLSRYRDRPAWDHTVEAGVYVAPEATGAGVGPALLADLVSRAEQIGHHVVLAQIVAVNAPSLKMTERAGFERVGYLTEVGHKFGEWLDIVIMQRRLLQVDG